MIVRSWLLALFALQMAIRAGNIMRVISMDKIQSKKLLNHYSAWKYLVLIVTIIVMLFSALPTWYGEDAHDTLLIGNSFT